MAAGPLTNVNLGQLLKDFGSNLWSELKTVLTAIGAFIADFTGSLSATVDDVEGIVSDWTEIKANVKSEIDKIKNFQFDPKLKQRVINVPIAIDQMHQFVDELHQFFVEKIDDIISPIKDLIAEVKADAASIQATGDKPSALARAATISHGIETSIHLIRQSLDAAKDVTELANTITDQLQNLEPLFLQQHNPRTKGKKPSYQRIGKLHR